MKAFQASVCALVFAQAVYGQAPFDPQYEAQTAAKKQADIYAACKATETSRGSFPGLLGFVKFFLQNLNPTFDHFADTLADGTQKAIHSVGTVATARYESVGDHGFTGVFQSTAHPLIVRLSLAASPSEATSVPGIAVKFLLDGVPSENFVAMWSLDGQDGGNFFQNNFSNHVPAPKGFALKVLEKKFAKVEKTTGMVGLSGMAGANLDGSRVPVGDVKFPFELKLVPNVELGTKAPFVGAAGDKDLAAMLATIAPETTLYDVVAVAAPQCEDQAQVIGRIVLTSPLSPTQYGDTELFFRHQKMSEDFAVHPEWETPAAGAGCPFLNRN